MCCAPLASSLTPHPILRPTQLLSLKSFIVIVLSVGSRPSSTHCCSMSRLMGLHSMHA